MFYLGLDDEEFIRGKVPMTKQEIRILTLVKARIQPDSIIYDIGAGTGSLSVEAARLAPEGRVYSLEKNPEGAKLIRANAANFALRNISVIEAEAPEGIETLPLCNTVLIGGSSGNLKEIMDAIKSKLKIGGRVVINCVTVQTLLQAIDYFRSHERDYRYEAIQVQVTRLQQVGPYDMAKAVNPVYILTARRWKPGDALYGDMNEKAV